MLLLINNKGIDMLQSKEQVKVNPMYTRHVNGSELLGFIPVENIDVCSYAIKQENLEDKNVEQKFVIATFAVPPNRVVEVYSASSKGMIKMPQPEYVFDSEKVVLEGKDKDAAKYMSEHIQNNSFVLVFVGSKYSKGMRFKNREEALEWISLFTYFDEVSDEKELQYNS